MLDKTIVDQSRNHCKTETPSLASTCQEMDSRSLFGCFYISCKTVCPYARNHLPVDLDIVQYDIWFRKVSRHIDAGHMSMGCCWVCISLVKDRSTHLLRMGHIRLFQEYTGHEKDNNCLLSVHCICKYLSMFCYTNLKQMLFRLYLQRHMCWSPSKTQIHHKDNRCCKVQ